MNSEPAVTLTNDRAIQLLREIVERRAPALLSFLHDRGRVQLSAEHREELRGVLAEELIEMGLGRDDEPTPYGQVVESLIDWLGHR